MESNLYNWLELLLVPITGVVTWVASRGKRRNDGMQALQQTVNMLAEDNKRLYKELTENKTRIAQLEVKQAALEAENKELKLKIENNIKK